MSEARTFQTTVATPLRRAAQGRRHRHGKARSARRPASLAEQTESRQTATRGTADPASCRAHHLDAGVPQARASGPSGISDTTRCSNRSRSRSRRRAGEHARRRPAPRPVMTWATGSRVMLAPLPLSNAASRGATTCTLKRSSATRRPSRPIARRACRTRRASGHQRVDPFPGRRRCGDAPPPLRRARRRSCPTGETTRDSRTPCR